MNLFRRQLTTWSPIGVRELSAATRGALAPDEAPFEQLRRGLREEFLASDVMLVDSGTHALQLALEHAAVGYGHAPVALPAFNCFDLATAAVGAGVNVLLYDVDPDMLSPDLESLEAAFRGGARVAVVAYLYGVPAPWPAIQAIADRYGATLIEDAAQGLGGSFEGRPLGALGQVSILSFARGKGWTGGRGGAVLARDSGRLPSAPPVRSGERANVVALAAQWALGRPAVYGIPRRVKWLHLGETHYRRPSDPATMPRSAARTLLASRAAARAEADARKAHAAAYASLLPSVAEVPRIIEGGTAGFLRLPVRVPGGMRFFRDPDAAAALGVAQSFPVPLNELEPLRSRLVGTSRYPGAAALAKDLITLPTHSLVTEGERERIVKLFR